MTLDSFQIRVRIGAWAMILFGVLTAFATLPGLSSFMNMAISWIITNPDGVQPLDASSAKLLVAISGGIATGWGVMVLGLSGEIARSHPETLRRVLIRGYVAWFVLDGIASLLAGAPLNLIGNAAFLAVLIAPLSPKHAIQIAAT